MLKQRFLTALAIGPISLVLLFTLGGGWFACFVGAIVVLSAWEWANLAGFGDNRERTLFALAICVVLSLAWSSGVVWQRWPLWLAFWGWLLCCYWVVRYPASESQWNGRAMRLAMGVGALVPCWIGLNQLRVEPLWLLYVLFVVWGADISAYFAGRAFGNRKLAPRVSPGKSWAGVYGGLAGTAVLAVLMALIEGLGFGEFIWLVIVTWIVTFASVLGDLCESMLKRHRGLKDSSQLLPGHGGILDRVDSLTAAVPIFALLAPWVGS
ncbi:CDP-archaeol synthase [Halotalea alkalilenta]|uniref:Phosphatidate cytidylyltransferase n=1 Tax=Halotalea alkalilenta TaxID=376489 RepID=A0A172YCG2_9GAMM|nr:CDP-archaeol synthase [Halotalea alkalilenta]ANF56939.1 phosphatidate cytidylyltransferase [Halotalea alkalilenta]